jgi:cation transport ATPase
MTARPATVIHVGMPDIDPARGMKVVSRHIAALFRAPGKTFRFCSAGCQTKLAAMAAMTLSSLSVIGNGLLLRGVRV